LQSVKKFPAFYGTRRFITAFTSARHLSLFWTPLIYLSVLYTILYYRLEASLGFSQHLQVKRLEKAKATSFHDLTSLPTVIIPPNTNQQERRDMSLE
jgi:hypothetical protein